MPITKVPGGERQLREIKFLRLSRAGSHQKKRDSHRS
jgi:hypothetical protein